MQKELHRLRGVGKLLCTEPELEKSMEVAKRSLSQKARDLVCAEDAEITFAPRTKTNNINMLKRMKTAKATEVPGRTSQRGQTCVCLFFPTRGTGTGLWIRTGWIESIGRF